MKDIPQSLIDHLKSVVGDDGAEAAAGAIEDWIAGRKPHADKLSMSYAKSVVSFSDVMLEQLEAHRKKGHWAGMELQLLMARVMSRATKMHSAVHYRVDPSKFRKFAADLANYAMMAAEIYEAEQHSWKWVELLNTADVKYNLHHGGISYATDADFEKAREVAKANGMEHMLEDDLSNRCKSCGVIVDSAVETCSECEEEKNGHADT